MDDRTSQRFGRYEILSELGRGAMGVVYKARDPKINRIVALKTISMAGQSPEEEREYRERFFREAEAAGRLSHPGIVTIFDVGEEPETRAPYIVMEFVGGEPLDKVLLKDNGKLPVETALQLALELAEGLDCAHRQGVVHRDLKPANILMTEDGHAKIADFGVAKLNLANHTLAGRALGTPAYMSPEQLNGEPVDGRSDLFSLGVILYTVLTGHRPFQGNSALTVSFKVVNREPIPATLLDTELPAGLDHIIERAMAKDPAERYQSGAEMVLDIHNLREGRRPGSTTKHSTSREGSNGTQTARREDQPALGQRALGQRALDQRALDQRALDQRALDQPAPVRPALGRPSLAAELLSVAHALPLEKAALAQLRKVSIAAGALLAGLFVLGLWVISFSPQVVRPRASAPPHPAETVVPVNTAAPVTTPSVNPVASAKTTRSPAVKHAVPPKTVSAPAVRVTKEQLEPSKPQRTDSLPLKVAQVKVAPATLTAVPPVLTPVVIPVAAPATLAVEVDHRFTQAHLSIWVDDSLTYTRELEGTDKKRLGVFHHVQGHELHVIQVAPGKHRLRVRVTSGEEVKAPTGAPTAALTEGAKGEPTGLPSYDQSAFVEGEFTGAKESVLKITFNKRGEINLTLQ